MSINEQLEECVVVVSEQLTWAIQFIEAKEVKKAKKEMAAMLEELAKMRKLLRELE